MRITEFSIKRPAAMTMIIMLFVVLGIVGYSKIGSDLFPEANIPVVTIVTVYPGAGPQEIETQVVEPLEEAVSAIGGLKRTVSNASEGIVLTVLEFSMATDTDIAAIDVQKAIDAIQNQLPEDAEKPKVQKFDFNAEPIMTLAISSERPLNELYDMAKDRVKQRLATVPGVAKVTIVGGKQRELRVEADANKLAELGLSVNQIVQRLKMENLNVPSGRLKQPETEYTVRLLGQYETLQEIENLKIPLMTGGTVALKEVATITDGFKEIRQYSRLNSQESVALIVQKQSDASIVDTAKAVQKELSSLKKDLPKDVDLLSIDDSSTFIDLSLADTKRNLVEGVLMTGIVLLFFLREWRSVFVVLLAIPTSIVATFMMMYFAGFTFNMLSLMGLSLCVGILVDDSIVVLENIHRHLKMGKNPIRAAIDGRAEIGMAAIAITLSDVVVFGPIAFMSGMVGQFFRQFGLTVVVATLFSLFVSFTMTPMLAALLYKQENDTQEPESSSKKTNPLFKFINKLVEPIGHMVTTFYDHLLHWALNHRLKILSAILLALIASVSLIATKQIGSEFMTKPDQGKFSMVLELPLGTSLNRTDNVLQQLEDRLAKLPEVKYYFSTVGKGGDMFAVTSGSHMGKISVILTNKKQRTKSSADIAEDVRQWGKAWPGAKLTVTEAGVVGTRDQAPIQVEITGSDQNILTQIASRVQEIVKKTPGTVDVTSSWKGYGQPEYQIKIDRLRAAENHLSVAEVAQVLRTDMEGAIATVYREGGKEVDLRVKLRDSDIKNPEDLERITVTNAMGQVIKLSQLADIKPTAGPSEINHKNRERLITISASAQNRSLGDIRIDLDKSFAEMNLPYGYTIDYYGEIKDMDESFSDLVQALILSILLVYMILVILYESFLTPFIRMLSLPCGVIGGLVALWITGNTLNVMSIIGFIMLDGLAAKNGTLLIDYTNTLMERGMPLREALLEAGRTRLRPIFMTSITMIFGMLPTALAIAEGAEIRSSMAVVLIGGLITSTLLTPVLIPVAYTLIDDFKNLLIRLLQKKTQMSA